MAAGCRRAPPRDARQASVSSRSLLRLFGEPRFEPRAYDSPSITRWWALPVKRSMALWAPRDRQTRRAIRQGFDLTGANGDTDPHAKRPRQSVTWRLCGSALRSARSTRRSVCQCLEAARSQLRRDHRFERFQFHRRIGTRVHLVVSHKSADVLQASRDISFGP